MLMAKNILIGNLISLSASVFLFLGSAARRVKNLYLFQIFECILLFIAQLAFGQGAAAVSLLIAAFRNFLLLIRRYTAPFFALIFLATLIFGLLFNTGGIVGILPLFATLIYTLTTFLAKGFVKVKLSLILNLSLWMIYSAFILDISSVIINFTSFVIASVSLINYKKEKRE